MLLRNMEVKTGKRLLKSSQVALMCSAFTGGKRFSTPVLLRGLGQKKKTKWCFNLLIRTGHRNGLLLLSIYQDVLESSAVKDGTIT